MAFQLVVVRAFGPHAVGDLIAESAAAASVLASEHASDVVRVAMQAGAPTSSASPNRTSEVVATVLEK